MAHNFFIGELGFNKVINDEHPYERATAPFRKEQFDNSGTVGDQSLAGWWTRGQLSFHKGAGVKYYEVLDGEEVLNRFQESTDVDTLSTPGEVAVGHKWALWYTVPLIDSDPAGSSIVRQMYEGRDIFMLAGTNSGYRKVFVIETPTTPLASLTHTTTSGDPQYICGDGGNYFYVAVRDNSVTPVFRVEKWSETSGTPTLVGEIYTSGTQIVGMWYAKDRLWILTSVGDLYAVSPDPASLTALSSPVGTVTSNGLVIGGSLTESPSGVYLAVGSRVSYVTISDPSGTPVIAPPVQVAEVPGGVGTILYHLGHLVMGSRVAEVQSGGGLVYGPKLFDSTGYSQVAASGEYVYLMGETTAGKGLRRINLASPIGGSTLEFAWETVHDFGNAGAESGVFHSSGGDWFVWFDDDIYATSYWASGYTSTAAASVGVLTTGYHRMGTLDGKHFHEVVVRASPNDGSDGIIQVSRVDADGTVNYLGAMAASTGVGTFALGLTAPVERVALRFDLQPMPGASAGPLLLGYQLKALPSPKRQRLIRVPLMMFDIERGATGRATGREKDAWVRYSALEALEESDALIDFEDKDTGETGVAYIESVELIQRNGSKGRSASNGFGGIVSVTLRKVD